MEENKFSYLKAYSNGRLIFLNLKKNTYLLSKEESRDSEAENKQIKYISGLRDNLRWPDRLIPSFDVAAHFVHSYMLSHKYKNKFLTKQIFIMKSWRTNKKIDFANTEKIERYSTLYQYLRNLLPQRPLCLQDSVCCFLFLSRYIKPLEFVIGVKYPPFAAHAWIESQNIILNDKKIAVEDYSVILRYDNENNL